jgi:hypothetical protein
MLAVNPFAHRHTAASRFSHYEFSEETLLALVRSALPDARKGYRDGVWEVPVPAYGFWSSVTTLTPNHPMVATYESRREGEEPRKNIMARGGQKMPAKSVTIIVYSSAVLAEDGDNCLPSDDKDNLEIISINASPFDGREPINPEVLMHNHFLSDGSSATGMSDSEFVATLREAFLYWKDKAMLA